MDDPEVPGGAQKPRDATADAGGGASRAPRPRAQGRREISRSAPTWTKKIWWFVFPTYGVMRIHDPNFEEHADQWREQQRRNYLGDDSR